MLKPYIIQNHPRRSSNLSSFGTAPYQRRDILQQDEPDDTDDSSTSTVTADDDTTSDDTTSTDSPSSPSINSISRALPNQISVASTLCNSNTPQFLGPASNGSFASNSPDGVYPSQTRSCIWTMQAISNGTSADGTTNPAHPIPYVIAVSFNSSIELVCGTDYLTLFDGLDTTAPVLAKICGNIEAGKTPTPHARSAFPRDEERAAAPTCVAVAVDSVEPSVTQTTGFKDFTPRSQHAMAYDSNKDMVYIMGGTSLQNPFMWDMLTYTFATSKWSKITLNTTRSPDPRYGHYAFMYNTDLYVYGGVTAYGALADIWKYNGKVWTQQQPINPEKLPAGRIGSACVVVTNNNSTKLYVFGGLNAAGTTTRDLNVYDINLAMWKKSDHQNSVGLSGATAVYHQATDSIYYFGGMVNQTTRNVITYQYLMSQDLWYALAPRIDPLTATPIGYPDGSQLDPNPGLNNTDDDAGDDPTLPSQNNTVQILPPVMYDSVTAVWAPAGLMGDDTVLMYGGMRPFGLGISVKDQPCFSRSFSLYDLSCQKWTTYDAPELGLAVAGRVNHTMVLRPPGAAGGNKTAWTAYIFGGFDGTDHADLLNVTINVVSPPAAAINSCRALRWCSLYDDCHNCNPSYCSYVNGLCLFDTDKTKNTDFLAGADTDIPTTATVQDLVHQRPELKSQVLSSLDNCPTRNPLDLDSPFSGTIQSGQEIPFKIYVDAHDLDIQFEIRTVPTSALDFKSLNVWEGFMNMYWRADHGLTDGSWNSSLDTTSPPPPDVPVATNDVTTGDGPIITGAGVLNVSELMNRWTNYAGLDSNLSTSAVRANGSYIYFPAVDPRRFSGYYVFSLTNRNPTALSFTVTVTLLDHPTIVDKPSRSQFNMATLGFFMLGLIFAVVLLIFMARKIRQLIEDRDASHRASEMQLLEDEDEERSRNGGVAMGRAAGSTPDKKSMYRIVVGVQDVSRHISIVSGAALRHRQVHGDQGANEGSVTKHTILRAQSELAIPRQGEVTREKQARSEEKRLRVRSDYIRDIGSSPAGEELMEEHTANSKVRNSFASENPHRISTSSRDLGLSPEEDTYKHEQNPLAPPTSDEILHKDQKDCRGDDAKSMVSAKSTSQALNQSNRLQRGWSMTALSRAASFRRNSKLAYSISEEQEGLTSQELKVDEESASRLSSECYDSEQEMVDLSVLSAHTDLLHMRHEETERYQRAQEEAAAAYTQQRRNPAKVQPLSVEPLPFHEGLVPRTLRNLKRYQKHLAQQQQRQHPDDSQVDAESMNSGAGTLSDHQRQSRSILRSATATTITMATSNTSASSGSYRRPSSRIHLATSSSASRRLQPRQIRTTHSHGSLRELHKAASRITLRTNGEALVVEKDAKKAAQTKSAITQHNSSRNQQQQQQQQPREWFGRVGSEEDVEAGIEMRQIAVAGSGLQDDSHQQGVDQQQQQARPFDDQASTRPKRNVIKMRGRQEYVPGPLLAMNYLIVFPGDAGSRQVQHQGDFWRVQQSTAEELEGHEDLDKTSDDHDRQQRPQQQQQQQQQHQTQQDDTLYNIEMRLPPMAIGTVFVPDPVRWWAYKAKQVQDREKLERQMRRSARKKEYALQVPQPAKAR
ncbi:Multiple epidermal growth factor-like domains protein 8 [Dissophora globulifera]|uniref:Multiple epidermal growth factor-like domains protein 8 n=1 Tax=Dissophora globulifera TaxID=979702 RepID=A0A9P6RI41_9FUNG|nr:Multiple epidermal growth factor-like domains protein 8 [Dissophora globulifera]